MRRAPWRPIGEHILGDASTTLAIRPLGGTVGRHPT